MPLAKLSFLFRFKRHQSPSAGELAFSQSELITGELFDAIFDSAWYLNRYHNTLGVLANGESITAIEHYLTYGLSDGRIPSPFFDAEWYASTYPDVPVSGRRRLQAEALYHYLSVGYRDNRNPNPIFDESWYSRRHAAEIQRNGRYLNGYHHFLAEGAAAGYSPSPLFEELWYRKTYPEAAAAIQAGILRSGYHDYMRCPPSAERRPCVYFDPEWYKRQYPIEDNLTRSSYSRFLMDGAPAGENPSLYFDENWYRKAYPGVCGGEHPSGYHHYLYQGAQAGSAPNPYFFPAWYTRWYPDVREKLESGSYEHAYQHYLFDGAAQGLSPNPYFDEALYLHTYTDVGQAVRDGAVLSGHIHYLVHGEKEGRRASTVFDAEWYRSTYPDVDEFIQQGLASSCYDHYFRYGRLMGRSASAQFDEEWYLAQHPDVADEVHAGHYLDGLEQFLESGMLRGYAPRPAVMRSERRQNVAASACAALELADFFAKNRELVCRTDRKPRVSIILILFNRAELTLRCLRSIINWADVPHEIVVIDNHSTDRTREMLDHVRGIRVICNDRNLHFLRAANQGAEAAAGEYLLFLNNDSELQVGALSSAIQVLENAPDIGAVGAKIILNNGTLQESGSYLMPYAFSAQFGRGDEPFQSQYLHRRDVPYCSGAFLMTRRSLFREMGGFDTAFLPAYCEDVDYCLRLWEKGLRTVFNPGSIIVHHETASSNSGALLWPAVLRNIAILRSRYRRQLEDLPDYATAPVGCIDGWHLREAYLVIIDSIESSSREDHFLMMIARMLEQKLFVTIYPLKPWFGERADLDEYLAPEVEIVGGDGVLPLEEFCKRRKDVYSGAICLSSAATLAPVISHLRNELPKGCLVSDEH